MDLDYLGNFLYIHLHLTKLALFKSGKNEVAQKRESPLNFQRPFTYLIFNLWGQGQNPLYILIFYKNINKIRYTSIFWEIIKIVADVHHTRSPSKGIMGCLKIEMIFWTGKYKRKVFCKIFRKMSHTFSYIYNLIRTLS